MPVLLVMTTRRTRSQEVILNLLKAQKRSLSAQDLYLELRQSDRPMGLATVYRSLDALKREGVVQARTLANGESLYSCAQEDQHHLTCLECGMSVPINQCPVRDLEEKLQDSHSFKIYYHTLEFFGVCDRCSVTQKF